MLARQAITNSDYQILGWGSTIILNRRELVDNSKATLLNSDNTEKDNCQVTTVRPTVDSLRLSQGATFFGPEASSVSPAIRTKATKP